MIRIQCPSIETNEKREEETSKPLKRNKFLPVKLLPHQKQLIESLDDKKYPIYVCFGMGSGKTIASLMCATTLKFRERVLVICDKSTVVQWKNETEKLLLRNRNEFANITVDIIHYEFLEQDQAPIPKNYQMCIVDEAHRFRNAYEKQSQRMLRWITLILQCRRVIYLSGTPITHDAQTERIAFDNMMKNKPLKGRVFFYNPRTDKKAAKSYPDVIEETVECEMSWAQCFSYLQNRRQTFDLLLEGEERPRSRMSSSKNTYNTLLRSCSNNPFPDNASQSPKFQKILSHLEFNLELNKKQIVYSSRRDTGVKSLQSLWIAHSKSKLSFSITGDMSLESRAENIKKFNRSPKSVLFITDAGGQGIDLKRVDIVHLMEPSENLQDEKQIVNRAVRFKSHPDSDSTVLILHYISVFPISGHVSPPWKKTIYDSGLFAKAEMKGISRRVQYALRNLIKLEENNLTIDQKILQTRSEREVRIQDALDVIRKEATGQSS